MKHLFIYLFTCLGLSSFFAQKSLVVKYSVKTNFALKYETTAILKIHKNQCHYLLLKPNSTPNKVAISTEDKNINIVVPESNNRPAIFMDLNTKILISYKPMFKKNNKLKEPLPKIDWEVINDFKTINGLNCQKAEGYFRGRIYTVWFSSNIPLPFGPWKLNGLPGLIIEAKDDKNQVYFRASKIEFKNNLDIDNFPSIENATTLKEFVEEIIPEKFKELESLMNSKSDRNTTISLSLPHRNHQKEIIYEWEETKKQ